MTYVQGTGSRTLAWAFPSSEQAHSTSLDLHHTGTIQQILLTARTAAEQAAPLKCLQPALYQGRFACGPSSKPAGDAWHLQRQLHDKPELRYAPARLTFVRQTALPQPSLVERHPALSATALGTPLCLSCHFVEGTCLQNQITAAHARKLSISRISSSAAAGTHPDGASSPLLCPHLHDTVCSRKHKLNRTADCPWHL